MNIHQKIRPQGTSRNLHQLTPSNTKVTKENGVHFGKTNLGSQKLRSSGKRTASLKTFLHFRSTFFAFLALFTFMSSYYLIYIISWYFMNVPIYTQTEYYHMLCTYFEQFALYFIHIPRQPIRRLFTYKQVHLTKGF